MTNPLAIFRFIPPWMLVAFVVLVAGLTLAPAPSAVAQDGKNNAAQPAPNAGADNAAATDEAQPEEKMNFLELLLMGEWFMLPIALCSLLGVTLIIERALALRKSNVIPPGFLNSLSNVFNGPEDRDAALQHCRAEDNPVARVIAVGIRKMPQGVESVEQGIEDAGANEVLKLRRNLRLLFGVASVAPMLGLLGTVWGMIESFQTAAVEGLGGGGAAKGLAGGIYAALVTTFAGLSVAIPILVAYYYFQGKIERIVTDLNDVSEQFVEQFMVEEGGVYGGAANAVTGAQPVPQGAPEGRAKPQAAYPPAPPPHGAPGAAPAT